MGAKEEQFNESRLCTNWVAQQGRHWRKHLEEHNKCLAKARTKHEMEGNEPSKLARYAPVRGTVQLRDSIYTNNTLTCIIQMETLRKSVCVDINHACRYVCIHTYKNAYPHITCKREWRVLLSCCE
jgi:hypothetical protein